MRVISGTARGTKLYSLDGITTRPTLDRVKESLFNMIQSQIEEAVVLDLFAGSGALGIECASRGASKVYFCDKAKEAVQVIQKNIEKTRLQEKTEVIQQDFSKALQMISTKFDIIFLDPPYDTNLAIEALKQIIKLDKIKQTGRIILETDQEEVIQAVEKLDIELAIYDRRRYGRVELLFIKRKG